MKSYTARELFKVYKGLHGAFNMNYTIGFLSWVKKNPKRIKKILEEKE